MKLSIVYGTRPEFLKVKPLIDYLKKSNYSFQVIKINQHVNLTDDKNYYDSILNIDNITDDRISNVGANILQKLPNMIKDSSHILAQGDTASVFYTMVCGYQLKKVCIHLEAGMRTYDLENPFPEEGYRQMISRITNIHLCPSLIENKILDSEKVGGEKFIVGNTILDLVKSYDFKITQENKVLITLHRRENWDTFKDYIIELSLLASKNPDIEFYFIVHPNPSLQTILFSLKENISKNFNILHSMSHKDLIEFLSKCNCVITDSGGIQEEANFLGKHIYVLRKITERQAIPMEKITMCNLENIKNIDCKIKNHDSGVEYGDGNSCEKIRNIFDTLK